MGTHHGKKLDQKLMERIPPVTFAKGILAFLSALNLSHLFCVCVLYHPQLNLLEFEKCISGVFTCTSLRDLIYSCQGGTG